MNAPEVQPNRRDLFAGSWSRAAAATGVAVAAAAVLPSVAEARPSGINDQDILNFALNLEYLEGEFYLRGVTGQGLDQTFGRSLGGQVRGGHAVSFSNPIHRSFMDDVARNELAHVNFIRGALGGNAVPRPTIDFNAGFAAVAQAAGLPSGFDPFADEQSFFIAAFLFEDVGVTAYKGAAPLLRSRDILQAAAGIEAVEAYHAGAIRTVIYKMGAGARQAVASISRVRDTLSGGPGHDQPVEIEGRANIVPANENGIAYSRTAQHVLNIVLANGASGVTQGGFFPDGLNGKIQST
ncbi:MAG TPA: ferritin-like domain-containing protein [Caulobacteraceae bacterium]